MKKSGSANLSIMMTDMQGYTALSSGSSRAEVIELIRRHNELMKPIIGFYGGHIIKTIGDAFLVVFESATDAVVCGIVIQLLLNEYNNNQEQKEKRLLLRVVINTGDVMIEEKDIYGTAVNITARMEGLGCFPGGSIGISESTYLLINRNEIVVEDQGEKELKGIPYKVRVYNVPLEKQHITQIPMKLSNLVNRALKGHNSRFEELMEELNNQTGEFLENSKKKTRESIKNAKEEFSSIIEEKRSRLKDKFGKKKDEISGNIKKTSDDLKNRFNSRFTEFKGKFKHKM